MFKVPALRISSFGSRFVNYVRTITTDLAAIDLEDTVIQEDNVEKELEIEKKRNKSRLSKAHFNIMHGHIPYPEPMHKIHLRLKYQRKMYARFGSASNVDPRLCWMEKREFKNAVEYESILEDKTIPEMMEMARNKREEEKRKIAQREAELDSKVAKISSWKENLEKRTEKSLAIANAAKEKKERLIEEVRRHFGFKVDPKDERFQEMLAEKETQQKKAEKQAKKIAREAKLLAIMQQKNAEITSS